MMKILRYFSPKEWAATGISLIFIVIQVWLDLKLPEYMAEITRLVETKGSAISDVLLNGKYMLLCTLGSLLTVVAVGFFASRIGASFSQRLRSMLFDRVGSFSMNEINKFSTASLITRSTNDITQVQMFVTMGLAIIKAPILAVWAVYKISGKGFEWTFATGVAVSILLLIFGILLTLVIPKFRKMQTLTDNLNRVTRENLTGLPVIRAYNAEEYQCVRFEKANEELTDTQLYASRAMAAMMPAIGLIMNGMLLAIYWIGAILINSASPAEKLPLFANMIVFSSYSMQLIMAFMMITMLFIMLPRAQVSAKRIAEVLDTEPSIRDGEQAEQDPARKGEVEFRNVSFKYPGAADYVLKDVSFSARQGETIAFIGSTGSGKSTIINLISRFYDATEGMILIDGVNVQNYRLESLYNKIGYIPQKAVIFSGTVASNVAFGEDGNGRTPNDNEDINDGLKDAVMTAQGTDFVENMAGAYNAEIARDGANISGGQKQRLAIARAVYKKPEIFLFDDSFSALDYKTDRALRTALAREMQGVTSMIVAQRIGTIMDADRIVVLNEGRVMGIGTHKELLGGCEVYREIAMSQLSEEELAI
jgi:ATP-binding cassette subfamily B protein